MSNCFEVSWHCLLYTKNLENFPIMKKTVTESKITSLIEVTYAHIRKTQTICVSKMAAAQKSDSKK